MLRRPLAIARKASQARTLSLPILVALAIALAALVSMLYLTQTSRVATTGYDVLSLEAQRDQWQLRNEQIRLRIAEAQALDRVESEAKSRLGMGPPEKVIYIRVGD